MSHVNASCPKCAGSNYERCERCSRDPSIPPRTWLYRAEIAEAERDQLRATLEETEKRAVQFGLKLDHHRAALRAVRTGYFHATLPGTLKLFDQWLAESYGIDLGGPMSKLQAEEP